MGVQEQLYEVALGENGYVTSADAVALGVDRIWLVQRATRPGLTRVARGLYHFDGIPAGATGEFMEAVLRVGPEAYLSHDSVLALHSLALVNPRRIRVGTPRRSRRQQPSTIEVIWRTLPPEDLTVYEGIPSATVHRALLDCAPTLMTDRLLAAVDDALALGLLTPERAAEVRARVR